MKVLWFLPTHGDGRYLGTATGGRVVDFEYLRQVAGAVDQLGYYGALLPTGRSCEDAWVTASALISATRKMRFLVAVRPGLISPTLAARMAATFDRFSNGRLLINVVTGGDPVELAGDGVFHDHDQRYEVTDEFLEIWRQVLASPTAIDFTGHHLRVTSAKTIFRAVQQPYPPLYFGGSSPAAINVAAKHADYYLTWGEPPQAVAAKIEAARAAAGKIERELRFGIRLHMIVRETEKEAWAEADRLISAADEQTIAAAQATMSRHDSSGQKLMQQLQRGGRTRADLEVSPNLWTGVGLVRAGAGTALVGSVANILERIREYAQLGIDAFILSGYPHLEEAYRVAELLFPHLTLEKADDHAFHNHKSQFAGELIGHDIVPAVVKKASKKEGNPAG
jgi:alkanesulfonate monooxygenase